MIWTGVETIVVPAWSRRKIRATTLAGTVRAVPMKERPSDEPDYDLPWYLLKLTVQVPGREPYDLPVRPRFFLWARPAEGDEWPVQVATNNLRRIRIDFSPPVTPQADSHE